MFGVWRGVRTPQHIKVNRGPLIFLNQIFWFQISCYFFETTKNSFRVSTFNIWWKTGRAPEYLLSNQNEMKTASFLEAWIFIDLPSYWRAHLFPLETDCYWRKDRRSVFFELWETRFCWSIYPETVWVLLKIQSPYYKGSFLPVNLAFLSFMIIFGCQENDDFE